MTKKPKNKWSVEYMRKNGTNKLQGKVCRVVLDKTNLQKFLKLSNRRDIRQAVVNRLVKVLKEGKHFETPLVTNRTNGKDRLLDGNHRFEAIEKYLNEFPDRKVQVWVFYYTKLDDKNEKMMYTKWNMGTKQSTNDFVKQYWNKIPLTRMIEDVGFPYKVSHCWSSNAIEFKTLVGGYLTKNDTTFKGGFMGSAMDFINEAMTLGKEDYALLHVFLKEFVDVFGKPDKKNAHYRQAVFYSLFRIWLDNYSTIGVPQMQKNLIKVRGHERIIYYQAFGGTREITTRCRVDLLQVMNGNRKRNRLI